MFGGNIIFAFHGDGARHQDSLTEEDSGFNICSDLLLPKKQEIVRRLRRFPDISGFWRTRLVKGTNEWRKGHRTSEWYIYAVDNVPDHIRIRSSMPAKYAAAMDDGMYLVASKILNGYKQEGVLPIGS